MKYDWDQYYALLLEWRDDPECGKGQHCNVKSLQEYHGAKLGEWLKDQRRQLRDEEKAKMRGYPLPQLPAAHVLRGHRSNSVYT